MLTQQDLEKIGKVVDEKIDSIKKDLTEVKDRVKKIDNTLTETTNLFDRDYLTVKKRVDAIEEHLGLNQTS